MLIFALISIIGFIFCAFLVKKPRVQQWDESFSLRIFQSRSVPLTRMMLFFTVYGKAGPTILIGLLLLVVPLLRQTVGIQVAISLGIITILANAIKLIVRRERPTSHRLVEEKDHSFPSAHAATSTALYGTLAFNMALLLPMAVLPMTLLAIFLSFLIGFSRVYLGIHYMTDVIGGWFLGIAVGALVTMWY